MITVYAFPGGRKQYIGTPDGESEKDYAFPGRTVPDDEGDLEEEMVSDSDENDPVLTEEDLEENDLTDEEAEDIEWDEDPQR